MKKYFLALTALLLSAAAFSQFTEKFGSTSIAESEMKTCAFDPEASAVVLVDEGFSDYSEDNGLMTYYHVRMKILKEEGIKYGNVKLSYYSDNEFETLENIEAISINIDDNGRRQDLPVDDKSIYKKKINKYRTELSFAFPNVKVGTIIEYKYRVSAKHYGGLRDWYFQSDVPVVKSSYRLKIVPGHEVSYLVQYNPKYKIAVNDIKIDHAIKFEMTNIPALINFGYKKSMTLTYVINLPANYKIDALPKNIKLVNSERTVTFTREIFQAGNTQLMARIKVDIDKTLFSVNEYPEIKDFFKQMVNLMNEQVVLKKI